MKTYSPFKFLLGVLGIINSHDAPPAYSTCPTQLEVIGAGLSKTGTQSTKIAFETLGYQVYNVESMMYYGHLDLVTSIYTSQGEEKQAYVKELHHKILETGSTVVLDIPCNFLFEELHQLSPHANVLLSVRDSSEKWLSSIQRTFHAFAPLVTWPYSFFFDIETYSRMIWFEECRQDIDIWEPWFFPWVKIAHRYYMEDPDFCRTMYDRHNQHVIRNTDPDLLTIYNVKQGWQPLLAMLNMTQLDDDIAFPQVNVGADMDSIAFFMRLFAYIYPLLFVLIGFVCFCCTYTLVFMFWFSCVILMKTP